jgi:hypothetical protein
MAALHTNVPAMSARCAGQDSPAIFPLTPELWFDLARDVFPDCCTVPIAELSLLTIQTWYGGRSAALSRHGPLVLLHLAGSSSSTVLLHTKDSCVDQSDLILLEHIGKGSNISFVPAESNSRLEVTARRFDLPIELTEDRDNFDYVFDLTWLAGFEGARGRSKRKKLRRFEGRFSPRLRVESLDSVDARRTVERMYDIWADGRSSEAPAAEREGIEGWSQLPVRHLKGCLVLALEVMGRDVAVSVVEPLWGRTWMGVIFKADPSPDFYDAGLYLRSASAKFLLRFDRERELLNVQQDMGLAGLRRHKLGLKPHLLVPKYSTDVSAAPGTHVEQTSDHCPAIETLRFQRPVLQDRNSFAETATTTKPRRDT